ncbi:sigma-70 family RNA polymerase sigma factor [Spongiactinospora sp. TRM90649]|uniref:sigma-70 family RNA polymerase sigma factor n=1 Tax=Spongiactinospora sp. TRM90649 TaxID=3031114 RepID=UPI0023F8AAE0|nr:sigma-70 family RNA polymerase sigma factor [Spongiactinospora sp. TRM90649]MDF5752783.1 sigma-70 family RNA polymerase sigma factor [Spongiactinospora sp. TRM90649]
MTAIDGDRRGAADEELTALAMKARAGEAAHLSAFAQAAYGDVRRFVAYLTDDHSADDLAQETFLRALRSLPRFAGRSSARVWLISIARRVVMDRFRTAAARPVVADLPDWQIAAERCGPRGLPGLEDGVVLAALLDEVPRERREAFVTTQLIGLSYAEAAALLGCPIGTVRSRVARARDQLAASLRAADRAA